MQKTIAATGEVLSTIIAAQDYSLVVRDGPHEGLVVSLDQESIRIGRAEWCDVVLVDDHKVSNIHCECSLEEGGVRIRDLRSRNGIFIEGCKVFDAFLAPDTRFQVGNSTLQLTTQQSLRDIVIHYHDENQLLVGLSRSMRSIFSMIRKIAKVTATTMLMGETGVGKTTVAQAIHMQSPRADKPFVVVNCAALPANLIEAQLFGYERGAFTGANKQHIGFFEQASGGTLLLDEIAELPLELQPKLLDVIERRQIRRLGGTNDVDVDTRLICATNNNLSTLVADGLFREDLYFRLSVVTLEVPPLRERPEDIPILAVRLLNDIEPSNPPVLTDAGIRLLQQHLWPGNIRQLRNILEYAVTFTDSNKLLKKDLQRAFSTQRASLLSERLDSSSESTSFSRQETHPLVSLLPSFPLSSEPELSLKQTIETLEKELVARALQEAGNNAQEAASILGISLGWLYNRGKKYELMKSKGRKKS